MWIARVRIGYVTKAITERHGNNAIREAPACRGLTSLQPPKPIRIAVLLRKLFCLLCLVGRNHGPLVIVPSLSMVSPVFSKQFGPMSRCAGLLLL